MKRVDPPQKPLSKLWFFAGIGLTLACALTLIVLALRGVSTDEFGFTPHLLILLVIGISLIASLAITEIIPWGSRSFEDWRRPKVLGSFAGLTLGALGLVTGLTPIFSPPVATEKTVSDMRDRLQDAGIIRGADSLIERNIRGLWGEPGCQVTYQMELDKGLLTVSSQADAPGQNPLHIELQAEPGTSTRLVASVLNPLDQRGDQHEFLYEQSGSKPQSAREFLTWGIRKREISLKLDRCPQEKN